MAQSTATTGSTTERKSVTAQELLVNSDDPSTPENAISESPFPLPLWEAAIAATRFGYGLRPGELGIIAQDPRGWLKRQIDDISKPDALKDLTKSKTHLRAYMTAERKGRGALNKFHEDARQVAMYEIAQHELLAFESPNPFRERLVRFWMNQFNLSGQDSMIYPLAPMFEREVVRPNLNKPFYQMLMSAYHHPAMLIYHNNDRSIAPISPTGYHGKYKIQESMAREILERHTIGNQGEYTEKDVYNLAAMLTGYTVGELGSRNPGGFLFRPEWHDLNKKAFMQRIYPAAGKMEFEAAMDAVARSPRTGWRIAEAMAKEFVSENPTEGLLQKMVRGFMKSSGNVMAMADAMINAEEAWSPVAGKVKSPHQLVISTYRALDKSPANGRELVRHQAMLGQPPYQAPQPAGWPQESIHWVTPELYADRIEWLTQMSSQNNLHLEAVDQGITMLGPRLRPSTARHASVAPSNMDALATLLCSPEFQRV